MGSMSDKEPVKDLSVWVYENTGNHHVYFEVHQGAGASKLSAVKNKPHREGRRYEQSARAEHIDSMVSVLKKEAGKTQATIHVSPYEQGLGIRKPADSIMEYIQREVAAHNSSLSASVGEPRQDS